MRINNFENSVIIVTGAASGIGREVALQAAQRGASVLAADRNEAELEKTKALAQQNSLTIQTFLLDISNKEAIISFAKEVIPVLNSRKLILVNNAGAIRLTSSGSTKS